MNTSTLNAFWKFENIKTNIATLTTQIKTQIPSFDTVITVDEFRNAAFPYVDDITIGHMTLDALNMYVISAMLPHIVSFFTQRKTYEHLILTQHGNFIHSRPKIQEKHVNQSSRHELHVLNDRTNIFHEHVKSHQSIQSPKPYDVYFM